ncbi:hypothetical protein JOC70_000755 [Clostridium pascui]|uniref:hypothetical protein n=1 Tax=Clostridium pascui TaxID=46609 RepID=UPI00195B9DC1|nr:hypothetical protein [Clostridium pascui]MBM7869286.1 hypothetical protein [Clostridium pascui]
MLTKTEFIMLFTRLMSGETVSDEDFNKIIDILKMQRLVGWDYMKDDTLSQVQNLLNIICENSAHFYETYLGQ